MYVLISSASIVLYINPSLKRLNQIYEYGVFDGYSFVRQECFNGAAACDLFSPPVHLTSRQKRSSFPLATNTNTPLESESFGLHVSRARDYRILIEGGEVPLVR
jgi:hypothetical protein